MPKLKREYAIALTVLGAVGLLIFGLNFLKGIDLFQRRNVFHAIYSNAQGLVESSALQYNGYRVGQVLNVAMVKDGTGRIIVTYQVNEDMLRIPDDSRITIGGDFFSKWAELKLGSSTVPAERGDTLIGDNEMSLTESISTTIDPLKRKAEGMLVSVDSVLTSLQGILNPGARGDIDASFSNIRQTLESLNSTAARLDALVASESMAIRNLIENFSKVSTTLADNRDELDRIFSNLDSLTAAMASGKLERTLDNVAEASTRLKETMDRVNQGQGTLGKLMADDSLYRNLNAASAELDLLLEDLRMNPNRYFSVFGKKDRLPRLSDADIQRIRQSMEQKR